MTKSLANCAAQSLHFWSRTCDKSFLIRTDYNFTVKKALNKAKKSVVSRQSRALISDKDYCIPVLKCKSILKFSLVE